MRNQRSFTSTPDRHLGGQKSMLYRAEKGRLFRQQATRQWTEAWFHHLVSFASRASALAP